MQNSKTYRISSKIIINNQEKDFFITIKTNPYSQTPLTLYNFGKSFLLAGERCRKSEDNGDGGVASLTVPSLVNYAFSVELFLKGICLHEGINNVRGHEIKVLFDRINNINKSKIEGLFNSSWHQVIPNLNEMHSLVLNDNGFSDKFSPEIKSAFLIEIGTLINLDLSKLLDITNNHFANVRYEFEDSNIEYLELPLSILAESVSTVLKDLIESTV
ncbi:MAG: hypothetical protein WCK98_06510 [bacterium]